MDGKIITNGAFTYSILECLKQNEGKELKVNALKQYTEKRVEEITNGKQKRTSRQETMEIDWGGEAGELTFFRIIDLLNRFFKQ